MRVVKNINKTKNSAGWVQQQKRIYDTSGIAPTLSKSESGNHPIIFIPPPCNMKVKSATKQGYETAQEGDSINYSVPNSKTRRGRVGVGVAQTLDTQVNQSVLLQVNIRRLTEIECERLQGFPDNWTKFGNFDGVVKEISRTQRYKMCGNAVTVSIVELIGRKLLAQ